MNGTVIAPAEFENSPVLKALKLLSYVAQVSEPPSLAEMSRALGLPKATGHRLALMLEAAGYVHKDSQTLRYSIGTKFEDIALSGLRNGGGGGARRLIMESLARRLGARVNFVVLRAGELTFVEWVDSTSALRVDLKPETEIPVHCSASGKLLMAYAPDELRRRFLKSAPFRAYTKATIITARALEREFQRIRSQGYGVDDQEFITGVNCLAVPIRNETGHVVAGLAMMAPVASMPLAGLRDHLRDLRAGSDAIATVLGWIRSAPRGTEMARKARPTHRRMEERTRA